VGLVNHIRLRQRLGKIRIRLVLVLLMAFLGMIAFGIFSYRFFTQVEEMLFFVSRTDQIVNTVLEVRRYEKNYLLYHHQEDYQQALDYLVQLDEWLKADAPQPLGERGGRLMAELRRRAHVYGGILAEAKVVTDSLGAGTPDEQAIQALRGVGKELIAISNELADLERNRVGGVLRDYHPYLISFLAALGLVVAGIVYLLLARIVKPLHVIEDATKQVAHGDFKPIPCGTALDEISTLVQAFNQMVEELQENRAQMIRSEKLTAVGTLTSGVAHELNNPLNNISTSCQILLEEMDFSISTYHRELLSTIEEQVAKGRDIVRSLLEFSGQRQFRLRPENLLTVVEDALKLIKGELAPLVNVVVEVPEEIVLMMDKAHMVQALLNLIQNGIQAMNGQGELIVRARQAREAGKVLLEVVDTGEGIPPEVMPRIFDPFFTTKDIGQGTGLGLSITYGIVERHQGQISVDSRPGQGTRFTIQLSNCDRVALGACDGL
jgi:signal transduction histidine kinase